MRVCQSLQLVQFFAIPWTVARQAAVILFSALTLADHLGWVGT